MSKRDLNVARTIWLNELLKLTWYGPRETQRAFVRNAIRMGYCGDGCNNCKEIAPL